MAKQLLTKRFSPAILDNWDNFKITSIKQNEYKANNLFFTWQFGKYSGFGDIDYEGTFVRNTFGDNFSSLTMTEPKHTSIKSNCPLYDDDGLEIVFNRILTNYFNKTL